MGFILLLYFQYGANSLTNYSTGHSAEKHAARYLKSHGYKTRALNWRTKWCEIDIIASKKRTIYFIEVKYRVNNNQGLGLDYITPKKLSRMNRAAESWVQQNNFEGNYQLGAIEVAGNNFEITNFITDIY